MKTLTAAKIAEIVGGTLKGNGDIEITGVSSLQYADPTDITFLGNNKYRKWITRTRAGAILLPDDFEGEPPERTAWIYAGSPNVAFTKIAQEFAPEPIMPKPGIHPTAAVDESAAIGENCHIGAHAAIGEGVTIGDNTIIEAGCVIDALVTIGDGCRLYPNVGIRERCIIGNRVAIHGGSVIGSDGFGYEPNTEGHIKIPQVGIVQIDDDVEIGSCTTIDRARFGKTWIQSDVKIDNLCHVAHNCVIGHGSFLMAFAGVSGSTTTGKFAALFGRAGIPGHLHLGDFCKIMGGAVPIRDVPDGAEVAGYPALPGTEYFRRIAAAGKVPALSKRVRELEAKLEAMELLLANLQASPEVEED